MTFQTVKELNRYTDEITRISFQHCDKNYRLGFSEFIMLLEFQSGFCELENYAGWVDIKSDGLYINLDDFDIGMTDEERANLYVHPTGNIRDPLLKFPFTIRELEKFLRFARKEGFDFPISRKRFDLFIPKKQPRKPKADS